MKFRNFLDVSRTSQQNYFKDGVELLYPDKTHPLYIAILPAYAKDANPTGWVPAVTNGEESDFYTTIRAAKFVGHGNRRAKTAFLSPQTFDASEVDPYEAFYDYVSRSDKWSYLTKDRRGTRLTGEVEGPIFPRVKTYMAANVMDVSAGSRGGVFVTELPESVAKNILYSQRKTGDIIPGLAFQSAYGDITDPHGALVIEIALGGKGYVARPAVDAKGAIRRVEVPETLLQHRIHMEEPGTFLFRMSAQDIVSKLAGLLRGYKSKDGTDEIEALKEAMEFAYGKGVFAIDEEALELESKRDPFEVAEEATMLATQDQKLAAIGSSVDASLKREKYTPVAKLEKASREPRGKSGDPEPPKATPEPEYGESIDAADIAAVREMLLRG